MKKIKFILFGVLVLLSCGCEKSNNLENMNVVTTVYPVEYVTNYLYGKHASVVSIYPNDTDSFNYELTNKQVDDYSSMDLFIYNGVTEDKNKAYEFLNKNKNLLIIDATHGMTTNYHDAELWLNPSNLLMLSENIKDGLEQYINNNYLKKEIDQNYDELKVKLSELDADFRLTATNASKKTIVVGSDALKFLEKYGFEVISLDTTNIAINEKTLNTVNSLIYSGKVTKIFTLERENTSDELKQIIDSTGVAVEALTRLDTIKDDMRKGNEDYLSLMYQNIDKLKSEVYE